MFETIHWSVYSKASIKQKTNKGVFKSPSRPPLLLLPVNHTLTSLLDSRDLSQAVLGTLLTTRKIGQNWNVNNPCSHDQDVLHFEGLCTRPSFICAD